MPIIILGMHRSGTSMITRLLHKCGLYLGEIEDLKLPNPEDNPEGYWEHESISNLNEAILNHFGGSWRQPPNLEPGWSKSKSMQSFWYYFEGIAVNFSSHPNWGWKDPRTSLTLEFWLTHIPNLKVLVCLRNPMEVADSLSTGKPMRDMEKAAALRLWATYHRAILEQDIFDRLIVTHYESYLYNPAAELRRVLAALDMPASAEQIEDALSTINPNSKHHRTPDIFVWDTPELEDVRRYYELLCQQAGEVFEKLRADSNYALNLTVSYARRLGTIVSGLNENINQQNQNLADYDQLIEQQRQTLTQHEQLIEQQQQSLTDHERLIEQQRATLADYEPLIEQQHATLVGFETHLAVAYEKLQILAQLVPVALQGFMYRRRQLSRIMAITEKLRNFWSIRQVTRAVHMGRLKIPALFDAQWYLAQYPDVKKSNMHPYVHFWLFGWYQGYQPMPLFDIHWYVMNYPYFNDNWANPLEHYESIGQYNGCRPCALFDPQWYLAQYPDVKQAGIDPLYHYYHAGSCEGRQPSPEAELSQSSNNKQE